MCLTGLVLTLSTLGFSVAVSAEPLLENRVQLQSGKSVADTLVTIPDANLRAILENRLGKASDTPIYRHEMATLRSLDARYISNDRIYIAIRNLEGIQFASNLLALQLSDSVISATSPLDLSPLASLTKLRRLWLHAINNVKDPRPLDLSPLSDLTNLTELDLSYNNISDISPLSGLTSLTELKLPNNNILDILPLSGLTNLTYLDLRGNKITDVSPLAGLTKLRRVFLSINNISDLSPLATNAGLGSRDIVDIKTNPLNATSISVHIPALQDRGVSVLFDEVIVFTDPQVYNDNVLVLPVSENLAAGNLPVKNYAVRFYEHFNDEFDFLMFVPNLGGSQHDFGAGQCSFNVRAMNDLQGTGRGIFSSGNWGSAERLQAVVVFGGNSIYSLSNRGLSILSEGPTLHELMHSWANFIVPSSYRSHWGFSSANGNIGGFDISDLVNHGNGRYTAGDFSIAGFADNIQPYCPIELYLAGFIPPEEVPDLWVAEDGEWLRDEEGRIARADNGDGIFTASRVKTYTIEDIISEHGPRVPNHSQAQKDFRAVVILLVSKDYPATREILETISRDVSWFSHKGYDDFDGIDEFFNRYNFYEATGGRGTITMDGLSRLMQGPMGGQPATLDKLSGEGRHGPVGTVLNEPFTVEVRDKERNPLEGIQVTFAITAGGGMLSVEIGWTDENGRVSTTLTLGSRSGMNTVTATVAGLEPEVFTAVGVGVPRNLTIFSGKDQTGSVGATLSEPFVVLVLDMYKAPVPGVAVTFEVVSGEGTLSTQTANTDSNGRAATTLTLGSQPGQNDVQVTVEGLRPETFTAFAQATPDFDGSGVVDFGDFFLFADAFGSTDSRFDLDGSGVVDFGDFFLFADAFGQPARAKLLALATELIGLPESPQLQQNAPNPFNSQTVIPYFLLQSGLARLEVFALTGHRVAILHQGHQLPGLHRVHWDGRDREGRPLASGVYLYRLVTPDYVHTRKLTLLR